MKLNKEYNGKTLFIIEMETCRILPCVYECIDELRGTSFGRTVERNKFTTIKRKRVLSLSTFNKFELTINPSFTKKKLNKHFIDLETKGSAYCIKGLENMGNKTYVVAFDTEVKAKQFLKDVVIPCQMERRLMAAEVHLNKYNKVISEISLFEKIKETL